MVEKPLSPIEHHLDPEVVDLPTAFYALSPRFLQSHYVLRYLLLLLKQPDVLNESHLLLHLEPPASLVTPQPLYFFERLHLIEPGLLHVCHLFLDSLVLLD